MLRMRRRAPGRPIPAASRTAVAVAVPVAVPVTAAVAATVTVAVAVLLAVTLFLVQPTVLWAASPGGAPPPPVTINVNGRDLPCEVPPQIIEGRTLAPLRAVFEALGTDVSWDGGTRTVTARRGETTLSLTVGSKVAYRNGREVPLDVPAQLVNDRTMVPLRFISESLDAVVSWDGARRLASVTLGDAGWVTRRDPRGFVFYYPDGWRVTAGENGGVQVSSAGGDAEALFWGAVMAAGKALDEAGFRALLLTLIGPHQVLSCWQAAVAASVAGGTAEGPAGPGAAAAADGSTTWIVRVTFQRDGATWLGAYLGASQGANLTVSGLAAREDVYQARLPILLKMLAGFRFDPTFVDANALAGVSGFDTYRDPNEGAFTLLVPRGWQVKGGLERPYIDAAVRLELTDGTSSILMASPYPPIFATPNWVLQMAGLGEGSVYNPGGQRFRNPYGQSWDMLVRRYRTAVEFIQDLYAPQVQVAYPGTRVLWVKDRPDVAAGETKGPGVTEITAAEARFEEPGGAVLQGCLIKDSLTVTGGTGIWTAAVESWRAPADKADQVRQIVSVLERSFKADPDWAKKEAEEVNKRLGIIAYSADQVRQIIDSTYQYRSQVQDKTAREWSKAILGVEYVGDAATGDTWEVPDYAGYYWRKGEDIFLTEGPSPPAPDPDFVELFRAGP